MRCSPLKRRLIKLDLALKLWCNKLSKGKIDWKVMFWQLSGMFKRLRLRPLNKERKSVFFSMKSAKNSFSASNFYSKGSQEF